MSDNITVTSGQLLELLGGITMRQLDLLATRQGINDGSGRHRRWTADQVRRLQVARALAGAVGGVSLLPTAAEAVFAGPTPPDHGWVAMRKTHVIYGDTPASLFPMALDGMLPAIVARVPRLWPG